MSSASLCRSSPRKTDVKVQLLKQERDTTPSRPTALLLEEALMERAVSESKVVKSESQALGSCASDNNRNSAVPLGPARRNAKRSAKTAHSFIQSEDSDGGSRYLNKTLNKKTKPVTKRRPGKTNVKSKTRGIKCAVTGCDNTCYDGEGNKTPYHLFNIPSDKTSEQIWREFLADAAGHDVTITSGMRLCSDHFDQDGLRDCYNPRTERYQLSSSLHPTILPAGNRLNTISIEYHPPDDYICDTCELPFPCFGDYYLHMESHSGLNSGLMGEERVLACVVCCKMFPGAASAVQHMTSHTSLKPYKCTLCDKLYDHVADRRRCRMSHSSKGARKIKKSSKRKD